MKRGRVTLTASFVATAALVAAGLVGCSTDGPSQRICVDAAGNRVDDDDCDRGSSGHSWYYIPHGYAAPAVGSKATGGSYAKPPGKVSSVSRGGFGGRSGGGGQ